MNRRLRAALRDIFDDVRARPGRAGLSFLALGVGMTALTVLLAVLGGLQERSRQILEELGAQVFAVTQAPPEDSPRDASRLRPHHVDYLRANLAGGAVSGIRMYDVAGPDERTIRVMATDGSLLDIRPWRLLEGRFLDAQDLAQRDRVAVATQRLSDDYGWRVGATAILRDTPFRIVGILALGSGALESETTESALLPSERTFFVPATLPPYWRPSRTMPEATLDALYVRAPAALPLETAVEQVRSLLTQPDQFVGDLSFITPEVLLQRLRKLQDTIRFTAGSIALLCLVLGGTTLMSLLVANVRERVTEIGLRRALGATQADIAGLFVLEAVLLTGIAAIVGAGGTGLVLALARDQFPVPLRLDVVVLVTPLFVATLLGAAFSFWPARAAARISPAEALRNE